MNKEIIDLIINLASEKSFSISKENQAGNIKYRAKIVLCGPESDLRKISDAYPEITAYVIKNNKEGCWKYRVLDSNCESIINHIYSVYHNKPVLDVILELFAAKKNGRARRGLKKNYDYEEIYQKYLTVSNN